MRSLVILTCTLACTCALVAADLPPWLARLQPSTDAWKKTQQVYRFNNGTEPQTLDPQLMTGVPEHRLALALFEGLVTQHPVTLEPLPGVADTWERSDDGLTWTFHLSPDARWSDGTPVIAGDFQASWKRVLTPTTASEYAYQLYPVRGAEDYHRGTTTDFSQVGIEVVDGQTLVVQLAWPCPYFLDLVAFATLSPVPQGLIDRFGDDWTRPDHFVGNGPFVLEAWRARECIVLKKNPHYRFADAVKLQRIEVYPYDDMDTALRIFREGKLDWMSGVPVSKVQQLLLDPDYYAAPYLGTYFYRFNCTRAPFDDARVRRALALAIDRTQITEDILKAGERPAGTFCPPGCGGYTPIQAAGEYGYDLDAARALWAQTPYGTGERPWPAVDLIFNTSENHRKVAENVVQQWEQKLGITVRLRNAEWQVYLEAMNQGDYQIMRSAWIGDYNDPSTFFDLFVTDGGNNRTGWSDPRYDALLKRSTTETDRDRRLAIFAEMEQVLVTDGCPIVSIYVYVNQGMRSERVQGWWSNIRDQHPFQYIWLED